MATLHYTSGGSATEIATAGFNLVDVQYLSQVNALPDGMKALVYLGEADGVTSSFIDKVTPFLGNPKVFGFYLADEPDPTGRWGTYATAEDLKAESDWIHNHFPGAKTFITMMNMGSPDNPDFSNTYNPANTGIDYFGLDPYPVRTGTDTVDYDMIDRAVAAAVESGIPTSSIVPVYQAFGGGNWETSDGGRHVMPTAEQLETMIDHWSALVPSPAFDYTYKWGTQNGDTALESSSELQAVFRQHNTSNTGTPPPDNSGNEILYGTSGADVFHGAGGHTMIGYGGNDTYYVEDVRDKEIEAVGGGADKVLASVSHALTAGSEIELFATNNASGTAALNLTGNGFAQAIQGNAGANILNGGGGADTMTGYGGNDIYYVDNAGDKVAEAVGGGSDRVVTSISHTLTAGSQIELFTTTNAAGTGAINLIGNAVSQTIQGNAGANVINGGGGADAMSGYGGNDTYYVDNASDKVREAAGGGTDKVLASASFALSHSAGSQVELLATTNAAGTGTINLVGNEFAQTIQGNAGANYINGMGGADTMTGYGGYDTYIVDNAGDKVVEVAGGSGDRVFASVSYALSADAHVELLGTTKSSGTGAINLTGNAFAQTIQGNAGANVIKGGGGTDTLTGNGGNDAFVFNTALGTGNIDRVTDFNKSQDKIHLDDAIFAGLKLGGLSSGAFFAGKAAHDSSDHIIYNSSTGALSFDSDGIGGAAQTQFATLSPGLSLTAASFFVT
ncbi:calcium-binding protein [Mesorhizobium sp. M0817]|uniref:calcium-binding protein n=1 Tax=unclassified Mesorhizobium TaxID=325217 RepID=UPI0033383447